MTTLIGLPIRLERTTEVPCAICCETAVVIGAGTALHCAGCNRRRGSLPKAVADFLQASVRLFGRPTQPITIRNSQFAPANEAALLGAGVAKRMPAPDRSERGT
jgi:hypothetical protein